MTSGEASVFKTQSSFQARKCSNLTKSANFDDFDASHEIFVSEAKLDDKVCVYTCAGYVLKERYLVRGSMLTARNLIRSPLFEIDGMFSFQFKMFRGLKLIFAAEFAAEKYEKITA